MISGGIGFFESGNDSRNVQYRAKMTTVIQNHDLQYGFLVQDIAYDRLFNRTGPTFTTPDGKTTATVPASTPLSVRISKDLAWRGFKFVGPTIVYAFMQACGMVDDHLLSCFRRNGA